MKNIFITCAVWLVLSGITGGVSYWKGKEDGKKIEKSDCQGGQIAAGQEDLAIKEQMDEVLAHRPDDDDFIDQLRDPKSDF